MTNRMDHYRSFIDEDFVKDAMVTYSLIQGEQSRLQLRQGFVTLLAEIGLAGLQLRLELGL